MTTPQSSTHKEQAESSSQHPQSSDKLGIATDALVFLGIIGAYEFMSLTFRYHLARDLFGLPLDSPKDIALCFLIYSLLILPSALVPMLFSRLKGNSSKG